MLYTYLKIALRSMLSKKLNTTINLSGLTLGISCCLLIAVFVQKELTYDSFHKNADRIALLQQYEGSQVSGGKMAIDLAAFAGVEKTARFTKANPLITVQETSYYEPDFFFADSTVFSMFTLPLIKGNMSSVTGNKFGVVISEKMATKYFQNSDPIGRELLYNNNTRLQVTAVIKDLPATSHLNINFIASYSIANQLLGMDVTNNYWGGNSYTYLLLAQGATASTIQAQFPAFLKQLNDNNAAYVWKLQLISLRDIYLNTSLIASSPLTYVYLFTIIGLFILVLACFNYVNLATAQGFTRAKEVGVRKVMGSSAVQLRMQFIVETGCIVLLSVLASVVLAAVCLPLFNRLADKQFTLLPLLNGWGVLSVVAAIVVVSVLAGSYPAFVLSRFQPAKVLKGVGSATGGSGWLRKGLVIVQFSVSIIMIAGTVVVYRQLQFMQQKNLGFNRAQVLTLNFRDAPAQTKSTFKQEVVKLASVSNATLAFALPGSGSSMGQKLVSEFIPKNATYGGITQLTIDEDFLSTFDIKLLAGRTLNPSLPADQQNFLVNEAAMKYFNWNTIEGKQTGYYTYQYRPDGGYDEVPFKGNVVGLMADYNHADLKSAVEPMIFSLNSGFESQMAIKLAEGNIVVGLTQVEALWKKMMPGKPFEYQFLEEKFNDTYKTEARTANLFGLFAGLAIAISCLGVLGLITHVSNTRRKEVGIRKVLGASVPSLVQLLTREFIWLTIAGWLIAIPITWWVMNKWLQTFAYRANISWWIFAVAGLFALLLTMLTIGVKTLKVALANPVKSLRTE